MQNRFASAAMRSHIITAPPSEFDLVARRLIAARDVSLVIRSVSFSNGQLAAVLDERDGGRTVSGSLLEVVVRHSLVGPELLAASMAEDCRCQIEAAFYQPMPPAPSKSKKVKPDEPAILLVAGIYQS